jgi:uncharacterized OB-fold protein
VIGVVHTYTTIHVGVDGTAERPYAVVVVDVDGDRRCAQAEGDLSWLSIGARAQVNADAAGPPRVAPLGDRLATKRV